MVCFAAVKFRLNKNHLETWPVVVGVFVSFFHTANVCRLIRLKPCPHFETPFFFHRKRSKFERQKTNEKNYYSNMFRKWNGLFAYISCENKIFQDPKKLMNGKCVSVTVCNVHHVIFSISWWHWMLFAFPLNCISGFSLCAAVRFFLSSFSIIQCLMTTRVLFVLVFMINHLDKAFDIPVAQKIPVACVILTNAPLRTFASKACQ